MQQLEPYITNIITQNKYTDIDNLQVLMFLKQVYSDKVTQNFYESHMNLAKIYSCTKDDLLNFGMTNRTIDKAQGKLEKNWFEIQEHCEKIISYCEEKDIHIITKWDKYFPPNLRTIQNCPTILFVRTERLDLLTQKNNIAIVGTREASELGKQITKKIAKDFSSDFNIISGLARGIDTAAHNGCIEQNKMKTIAVVVDVERITPLENLDLAEKILLHGGALLSENEPNINVQSYHFTQRNRIQSGMSLGVFPIESNLESGTKYTVEFAKKQGRRIYCPDINQLKNYHYPNELIKELILNNEAKSFTIIDYKKIKTDLLKISPDELSPNTKNNETIFNEYLFINYKINKKTNIVHANYRWYIAQKNRVGNSNAVKFSNLIIDYKNRNARAIRYFADIFNKRLIKSDTSGMIALIPVPNSRKTKKEELTSNQLLIREIMKNTKHKFIDMSEKIARLYDVKSKTPDYDEEKHIKSIQIEFDLRNCNAAVIIDDVVTRGHTSYGMIKKIKSETNFKGILYFFSLAKYMSKFAEPYYPDDIKLPDEL